MTTHPQAVADHLWTGLCEVGLTPKDAILKDIGNVESLLAELEAADRGQIALRLRELSTEIAGAGSLIKQSSRDPESFGSANDEDPSISLKTPNATP